MEEQLKPALALAIEGWTAQDFADHVYDTLGLDPDPEEVERVYHVGLSRHFNGKQYRRCVEQRDTFPFVHLIASDPVGDLCRQMAGGAWPVDHPVWRSHLPPHGPDCGCCIAALTETTAMREGIAIRDDIPRRSV